MDRLKQSDLPGLEVYEEIQLSLERANESHAGFDCDAEPRNSASGRGRETLNALAVRRSGSTEQTVEEVA